MMPTLNQLLSPVLSRTELDEFRTVEFLKKTSFLIKHGHFAYKCLPPISSVSTPIFGGPFSFGVHRYESRHDQTNVWDQIWTRLVDSLSQLYSKVRGVMASYHTRPPKSMGCQKWARCQYRPPGWYWHLAHFWQSIDFGGLLWYDAITPHTFKYSSEKDSTRCVHIWSQTLVWSCLLSYLWTPNEKGPPKMGVDTDEMGGRHLYTKWPCLNKIDEVMAISVRLITRGKWVRPGCVRFWLGASAWPILHVHFSKSDFSVCRCPIDL